MRADRVPGRQVGQDELDIGAQFNVLSKKVVSKLGLPLKQSSVKRITSYTQHNLRVVGDARETCIVRGKTANLRFFVVDADVYIEESDDIYESKGCIKD